MQMQTARLRKNSTGKVYSEIWTRSIPFRAQETKHSTTAIATAGAGSRYIIIIYFIDKP